MTSELQRPALLSAGALVGGRYRLASLIGAGGMGSVWRAEDERLHRLVAVKLLRMGHPADTSALQRFRAEARSAASVNHPNVVAVYDYGEQAGADGETLSYLVMELVEGHSLASELAAQGRLAPSVVRIIIEQATLGLSAAHAQGVVHRDVKPGNLLLAPAGTLKITDFGIARTADADALTRTGTMVGTAGYLSPEQAEGKPATPASDLYSLGVVAFACLAGAPPFERESALATMLAHVRDPLPPLPADTPPALAALVVDLLAKDPARRPASALVTAERARAAAAAAAPPATGGTATAGGVVAEETVAAGAATAAETRAVAATGATAPTEVAPVPQRTDVLPSPAAGGPPAAGVKPRRQRRRILLLALGIAVGIAAVAAGFILTASPAKATVPRVLGEQTAAAKSQLAEAGLKAAVKSTDSPNHAAGEVVHQSAAPGTKLAHGAVVQLTVATGDVAVAQQAYVGEPYNKAAAKLLALGLKPVENLVASPGTTAGDVLSITPTGRVKSGATVTLGVAYTPTTTTTTSPPTTPAVVQPKGPGQGGAPGQDQGNGPGHHGHGHGDG